ncbi:tetratricopeptide repeat protein [Puia sp.]|jgi:Tfp pilus assembly protein PilF|uniref:tetratricopeptide repeat protein n=1 Tax=Puia sp. TaxID=2045100 RepID=UPI002F420993
MNRILVFFTALTLSQFSVLAQSTDDKSPQTVARGYTQQGDYTNAIVVLNTALQKDPQNLELSKDLAFNYYLSKDYIKGVSLARALVDRPDADVQSYQIAAMLYKAIDQAKECEKLYRDGLKKYPRSGPLHSEYGEMLWARQDYGAIKEWEKGIEVDPNYSGNYYFAAKYYYFTYDKVWSLLYGEIFLNLESYTKRTAEIKELLLEGYKKLYTESDMHKNQDTKSPFVNAWLNIMGPLNFTVKDGITAESLTVLRTKFILNWFTTYPTNYPYRLFDFERQLLKEGMFDAYNEWIFGAAGNLPAFQTWTNVHNEEYKRFIDFQRGRVFKMPEGQYYQVAAK